jgi:hypothetical protein
MKNTVFSNLLKRGVHLILIPAILFIGFGTRSTNIVYAQEPAATETCGQLLAEAESRFLQTLAPDGSVPASPEVKAAASEYIRVSKLCYEEIEANNAAGSLHEGDPVFIDDGGVRFGSENSADYVLTSTKWGSSGLGTPGGTVTYSFMGSGISFSAEGYGNSIAITSLPGFEACFFTDIQMAFAAWQAVSNIQFVQVTDSGAAFNAPGATGDIRIGAHAFDGPSNTLAHAYFPPPNGYSAAGDLHFDSAENWKCNTTGIDIGIVALHEIGHSLGLNHENTAAVAVMDPYYNPNLTGLQPDDRNGITAIYGPAQLSSAPSNDSFAGAKTVSTSLPYTDTLDTTGAIEPSDGPAVPSLCDNKSLRKGLKNVWYKYTPEATKQVYFDSLGSTPAPGQNDYDTYIAVWRGSSVNDLTLVGCDDDTDLTFQSQLLVPVTAGVTYYIEIAQYNGVVGGSSEVATGGTLKLNVNNISQTDIKISTPFLQSYKIPHRFTQVYSYPGTSGGPVQVKNTFDLPIVTSLGLRYKNAAGKFTFSELMGVPTSQLSNDYWLPYYKMNTTDTDSQVRFTNTSTTESTTVSVYLGNNATPLYTKLLPASSADRVFFANTTGGPVRIVGSNPNAKILAGMRVIYGGNMSFDELMAYPTAGLSSTYWFPFYNHNNVNLFSELRIANTSSTQSAQVQIYIGGALKHTETIPPLTPFLKSFPGLMGGPVRVVSTGATPAPIVTSLGLRYKNAAGKFTFSELMGVPTSQLSNDYWLPYYKMNTTDTDSQVRFTNTSTTESTTVSVYLGNNATPLYTKLLPASSADRVFFANTTGGPVRIVGSNPNVKILAGMRVIYGGNMSFDELMAYPTALLSSEIWFPFYNHNNVNLFSDLRVGLP